MWDPEVKKALAHHRIFSFFGYKTAASLANINRQLAVDPDPAANSRWSISDP